MSSLQTDPSALEGSWCPGGRRHICAHVRVGAGIGTSGRAHHCASVLIRPSAVSEIPRTLIGRVPAGVTVNGRVV